MNERGICELSIHMYVHPRLAQASKSLAQTSQMLAQASQRLAQASQRLVQAFWAAAPEGTGGDEVL